MPIQPSSSSQVCLSSTSFFSVTSDVDNERKRKFGGTTTKKIPRVRQSFHNNPVILRFSISDFARLSHPKGSFVESRPIRILNKSWNLRVYPRGHGLSRADKTLVSCFLTVGDETHANSLEDEGLPFLAFSQLGTQSLYETDDFEFSFRIRNWTMISKRCGFRSDVAYGFMGHSRENILRKGLKEDGSLVVDVAIKFWPKSPQQSLSWYSNKKQKRNAVNNPCNTNSDLALQLFRSHEFADLFFRVGKTVFQAHKCVLALRAKTLVELALGDETDEATTPSSDHPIAIPGVEEEVFRAFLEYVYTSNEEQMRGFLGRPTEDNLWPAVSLLVVADKFGAIDLKAFVESVLANEILSPVNCCEMLLLADSHWCSILKEKALDLFCADPMASIKGSPGWTLLKNSPKLLSEILLRSAETFPSWTKDRKTETNNDCNYFQDLTAGGLWGSIEAASLGKNESRDFFA